MIQIIRRNFSQEEWNETVSGFDDLSLMQTWEYADAKTQGSSWKVERAVFVEADRTVGAVQATVRFLPWRRRGLVWISRGPLWRCEHNQTGDAVVSMLEALRRTWVTERGMYLRILPTFLAGEVPAPALSDIGYHLAERSVIWSSAAVDLSQSKDVLRSRLQQKWRNCLNKAERQDIIVQAGSGADHFGEVIDEYRRMLQNKGFSSVVTPELLIQLQHRLPQDRKLWALVARQDNKFLGGVLIARYGKTCEYLVGAVNDSGKAINAGQLLLWQAICQMKELGLRWFDVGGTDPLRTPRGILHFKKGIGGEPYELGRELEAFEAGLVTSAIRWRVKRERQIT